MDGVNLSTEVVYKKGQDYRFACYDRGRACRSYRVRFLCGKPGKQPLVGMQMQLWHGSLNWQLCRQPPDISVRQYSQRTALLWHRSSGRILGVGRRQQNPTPPISLSGKGRAWSKTVNVQMDRAVLPCRDVQLFASLGAIILNPVPKVLVRRDWKWSGCSQRHLAISRRQSLGMKV